jgi:flagellar FliL protein
MATTAKSTQAPQAGAIPKKTKAMLIIVIGAVVLLLCGGAAIYLMMTPLHPPKSKHAEVKAETEHTEVHPFYVELGTFTANLINEDSDRYLQVAITLKLTKAELDEKIKTSKPELLHRVNMLLQSKRPSELATVEGKDRLAGDIKDQVEYVLGIRKDAPVLNSTPGATMQMGGALSARSTSLNTEMQDEEGGVSDVLFTSFIVQ